MHLYLTATKHEAPSTALTTVASIYYSASSYIIAISLQPFTFTPVWVLALHLLLHSVCLRWSCINQHMAISSFRNSQAREICHCQVMQEVKSGLIIHIGHPLVPARREAVESSQSLPHVQHSCPKNL